MQIFQLSLCQYLKRHLTDLSNNISYADIAQSLLITIHSLLRHSKLAADIFFVRLFFYTSPFRLDSLNNALQLGGRQSERRVYMISVNLYTVG